MTSGKVNFLRRVPMDLGFQRINGDTTSFVALRQWPANCTLFLLTVRDTGLRFPYIWYLVE